METAAVKKKTFLQYIDAFRGLAIILIVASHILAENPESTFYRVLEAIFLNSTAFFVFISGFLFQYLAYKYSVKDYWKRKLRTIIIPYLVISIPAIALRLYSHYVPFTVSESLGFADWNAFQKIAYFYLTGSHLLPFWYIPVIVLFYVIASLLVYLDQDTRFYWLLPLFLVVSLLLPRDNIYEINNIPRMFGHFFSIYVLGMFFCRYRAVIFDIIQQYHYVLTGVTLLSFVISCLPLPYVAEIIFIQKVLLCFLITYWLKVNEARIPVFFSKLAVVSFGIYFVHYYVILAVRAGLTKTTGHELPQNLGMWIVVFVGVFALSYGVVMGIKLVFGKRSRLLIGC